VSSVITKLHTANYAAVDSVPPVSATNITSITRQASWRKAQRSPRNPSTGNVGEKSRSVRQGEWYTGFKAFVGFDSADW